MMKLVIVLCTRKAYAYCALQVSKSRLKQNGQTNPIECATHVLNPKRHLCPDCSDIPSPLIPRPLREQRSSLVFVSKPKQETWFLDND